MAHLKTRPVKSDWNPLNKNWPCDLNQVRQIFQMHWFSHEKNGWFSSNRHLVGGWTNPFEKYQSTWIISPGRDDNKTYLKPPPSHVAIFLGEVTISLSYFYPKNNLLRWDDLDTLENPPGRQLWRLNTGLPGWQRIDDWLVVEPNHLKNMLVKLETFPNFRGENSKNIWVATT